MAHDGRWSGRAWDALTAMGGDGDRPRGGGTESNRARAARGGPGPDVLSVYLDGERAAGAPMDRVAVGVDRASAPPPVAMMTWTRPDGATVVCGSDGVDRVTLAAPQPDPAPGQVWAPPVGAVPSWVDVDGTVTIASDNTLDVPGLLWLVHGGTIDASDLRGWTCIGVATPHGRVMVGDGWRRAPDHEFTVTAIASEDGEPWIKVRYAGGQQDHDFDARNLWDCAGYHRTRYAPARAGERYRNRQSGAVKSIGPGAHEIAMPLSAHGGMDPAQWERLDGGARSEPIKSAAVYPTSQGRVGHNMAALADLQARREGRDAAKDDGPWIHSGIPRAVYETFAPQHPALKVATLHSLTRDGWKAEVRAGKLNIARGWEPDRYIIAVTSPNGRRFMDPMVDGLAAPAAEPQSRAEVERFLGFCMAGVEAEGQGPAVGSTIRIKRPASVVEAERARATGAADAETDVALRDRCITSTLTLQATARDLRALFDAIGRALEATKPHSAVVAGQTYLVMRDEMLFRPEVAPAANVLVITADTRALHALRRCLQEAMTTGRATLAQWGAKGPRVEVAREGPAMGATAAGEPAEPVRYQPSEGGADAWRWGGDGQ